MTVCAVLLVAMAAAGCGGGGSDYERDASALCRSFNRAAYAGHLEIERARRLYARLGDGFARLAPPAGFRRSHAVMSGFARSGERLFAGAADPSAPKVDLRLTVGDWEDDVPRVARDLPDCADTLTATHPEIRVIR